MSKLLTILATAALLAAGGTLKAAGADSDRVAAGRFSAVRTEGRLPVELRQVPDSAGIVIITASERALPLVAVANSGGTLCLSFTGRGRDSRLASEVKSVVAYCGRDLSLLTLEGSCSVTASGLHSQADITAVVTGSGSLCLRSTSCANLTASLTGSGVIRLEGLRARNCSTSLAGSGSLRLSGIDATAFNCTLSGSGIVRAAGHAAKASLALRGSGTLDARELMAGALDISVSGSGSVGYNRGANELKILSGHDNGGTVTNRQ